MQDTNIEYIVKMMEEMVGKPRKPYERQPGELNSYEKYNREKFLREISGRYS